MEIIIVCIAAFAAGFIDAVVGGGGLVQTPAMLITFPNAPVATLLGTVKIPSFCGTAVAAYQYNKRIDIRWKLIGWVALAAFAAAMFGSYMVSVLNNGLLKPIILGVLILVALFTYTRKTLGHQHDEVPYAEALWKGVISGLVIGFYDGFIGPGTGSFLVLVFITMIGHDFMHASAHAKMINLATNLASIIYFSISGNILFHLAIPMAICNMAGGWAGTRMALLKGNAFIRAFFLLVVTGTILRFAWDIFFK
ncbi:MAG TPA: sulfite exporter TauE/SafE family protein [Phnomibacter sp.]|nr:sulfite exporter TauE/SafE family protein [Phnomibacter sp.]